MRKQVIRGSALVIAFFAVASTAISVAKQTFPELTAGAADVAIVEVTGRRPVTFEFDGETDLCGHVVEARVLRSFRGSAHSFQFLDPGLVPTRLRAGRFLVFAFVQRNVVEGPHPPETIDSARARCTISASERLILLNPRTMFRFTTVVADPQEWLLIGRDEPMDLDGLPSRVMDADTGGTLVPWGEVEREIQATLAAVGAQSAPFGK